MDDQLPNSPSGGDPVAGLPEDEASATGEVTATEGSVARGVVRAALAEGSSYSEAAAMGGVSKRTVTRWMGERVFGREVADLRSEHLSEVTGQLGGLAVAAVAVLREGFDSERDADRLRAAQLTLEWAARLRRDVDVEGRLLELERRQGLRPVDEDAGGEEVEG